MKNKTKTKVIAVLLAFLMIFVNLPITSVYSDDSIKDMRTYTEIADYIEATSNLLNEYPCDLENVIYIDLEADMVTNFNGEKYEAYDDVISSVLSEDMESAQEFLTSNGYEVLEVGSNTISVEDPYQTKRIIIEDDNLTTGNGAEKIIHFGNEYILQYSTIEDTINAYHAFLADPTIDNVYLDVVVSLDVESDRSIEDFYVVVPDGLVNGYKEHYSWGVTTMGLDKMQDNLLAAGYTLDPVTVAVLDSGVNHENKYLENRILVGYNYVSNNDNTMDDNGHGTHVAGIVCDGTTSNVKILPVKVLNSEGKGSLLYVKNGIYFAVTQGAEVINLSLSAEDTSKTVTYLESTFKYAIDNNAVICSSAGNDQTDVANYYPSRSPQVITVGALDTTMRLAYYSNVGEEIDFCVPGSSIISTYQAGLAYKSGTSMSTPHVSACVALLKTWNPDLTFEEVKQLLIDNSIDLGTKGKDNNYGYGYINLANFNVSRGCKHEYISNITLAATCTKTGSLTYTCKHCNNSYSETIPSLGHDYQPLVIKPTCIIDGYTTYTCSRCSDSYTSDIVKAQGHNYVGSITRQPTCEDEGQETFTCSGCNDHYTTVIPAKGHKYTSKITTVPTHFKDGVRTYTCENCGHNYTETIPMNKHNFTLALVSPTCTEQGYTLYTCDCGYSYKDNFTDPIGHDYKVFEHKDSTCTMEGYDLYTCTRCTDSYTQALPKLKHDYVSETIAPTCEKAGMTIHTCTKCGLGYESDNVPALGHDYIATVTNATCESDGFTTHKCSRCDKEYVDTIIKALGHNYLVEQINPTCEKDGSVNYTCDRCGDTYSTVIKTQGHSYYKEITYPTCEDEGIISHVCNVCGHSYEESRTPALGHKYISEIINPTCSAKGYTKHTCERCGDAYNDSYVNELSHEYTIIKEEDPTCMKDGYMTFKCKYCDDQYTETITHKGHDFETKVVDPKCNVEGYTLFSCKNCDFSEQRNFVPALTHNYHSEVTLAPTCENEGTLTYTCEYCGDSYTEVIPETGHSYKATVKNATCTEKGYTLYECENCDDSYKDNYIDMIAHDYEAVITKQPTHLEEGITTYTCKNCPDSYVEPIEKGKHDYEVTVIAPTCENEGYTLYECKDANCKHSYKDNYVEALKHEYESKIALEASCGLEGIITYTCKYCGNSYNESIPALKHNYTSKVVDSTCTNEGYTLHTCTLCNHSYKDNITGLKDHNYNIESRKEPTCKAEGSIVYKCQNCGDSYTTKLDKLDHNYVAEVIKPTCTAEGYTLHTCSSCGDNYKDSYINKIAHNETDWKIDKAATCEKDGSRHKECTVCGTTTITEVIPATGHDYKETVKEPTKVTRGYTLHTCKNCGDSYKDNYVECETPIVNTVYKVVDTIRSVLSKLFG